MKIHSVNQHLLKFADLQSIKVLTNVKTFILCKSAISFFHYEKIMRFNPGKSGQYTG